MFVEVNGTRLYVDVEGSALVPDGPRMRPKPTLLLLHGGPGFDHSMFKPLFAQLRDLVQVIYYDHRGNGRSKCPDRDTWTLAQWGEDVKGLCDALGILKPIVFGFSFGGIVAQAYATRYPKHARGLVLASTLAKMEYGTMFEAFSRIAGAEARAIAEGYWTNPTPKAHATYLEKCHPHFNRRERPDPDMHARMEINHAVATHFAEGEMATFDYRAGLPAIRCPVLVTVGDHDPVTPLPFSEEIVRHLTPRKVRFEIFEGCGHGVHIDAPRRAMLVLRDFIEGLN